MDQINWSPDHRTPSCDLAQILIDHNHTQLISSSIKTIIVVCWILTSWDCEPGCDIIFDFVSHVLSHHPLPPAHLCTFSQQASTVVYCEEPYHCCSESPCCEWTVHWGRDPPSSQGLVRHSLNVTWIEADPHTLCAVWFLLGLCFCG